MIKLKGKDALAYSAFFICRADPCSEEATRIWANSESNIIDLCDTHYDEVAR